MKRSIQILFLVLLCSCGILKKGKKHHENYNDGNLPKDSLVIDLDSIPFNDILGESTEPEYPRVVITSGEIWNPTR